MDSKLEQQVDEGSAADLGDKDPPDSISELLDYILETSVGKEKLTTGEVLKSLKGRSHGPMLLLPALLAISPVGMIPGMSVVTGSLIVLISFQIMFFSTRLWIPQRLENAEFDRSKLEWVQERFGPWLKRFETLIGERLVFLTKGVMLYPIAATCMVLALMFYPLALVPFGVLIPGVAVACFALGITSRDGFLVILGFSGTAIATAVAWRFLPF